MTNDEIIRRHAIEFVNCYWNVPYDGGKLFKNVKTSLMFELIADNDGVEKYERYFDENIDLLDSIINILNDNISECCYVLSNYAIADDDIFHYLGGKITNELVNTSDTETDWYYVVKLDYEYRKDGWTYQSNKLFIIGDDNYKEVLKKTKTIEYYEVKK